MEKETNYIIGFDLGKQYAQISFVSFEGEEGDIYNIPVCLCKRNGANQWFYGEEAQKFAAAGKGSLIKELQDLAAAGEPVLVDGQEMDPVELLSLFIRSCLSRLGVYKETVGVKVLVLSVETLSAAMLAVLEKVKNSTMREFENVYFEPKAESLFYYIIHQPKELWSYEVDVLDFSDTCLKISRVEMNHKTRPVLTTIEEKQCAEVCLPQENLPIREKDIYLEQLDEKICELMEHFLEGRIVTGIYLTGKIFEKEWYPKTLKLLCKNRRVFQGSNLYSKGACLGGMEKITPGETAQNYLYLGKEKLQADVSVLRAEQGKLHKETVLAGGVNWFEAKAEFTFLPGEDYHLPIVIMPLNGAPERVVPIVLPKLKNRDMKSLKFVCRLSMKSENELAVEIEDLGFGAFYKPMGKRFEEIILLGGSV
jgi:hypothetical protein